MPLGVQIIVPVLMMGIVYIDVGLSALLGSTNRAMRESLGCAQGTELAPRSEPELNFADIDCQYITSGGLMR